MDYSALVNALPTLVGALVGAAASIVATALANRSASKQQHIKFKAEIELEERRFQRENYLAIQPLLLDLARGASLSYQEDCKAFEESGSWNPKHQLSDQTNTLLFETNKQLIMLIQRVDDDEMRALLSDFRSYASIPTFLSKAEADAHCIKLMEKYDSVNDSIGKMIRELAPTGFADCEARRPGRRMYRNSPLQ